MVPLNYKMSRIWPLGEKDMTLVQSAFSFFNCLFLLANSKLFVHLLPFSHYYSTRDMVEHGNYFLVSFLFPLSSLPFFFFETGSRLCNSCWPDSQCSPGQLKLMALLLSQPPKYLDCRHLAPCAASHRNHFLADFISLHFVSCSI